MPGKPYPCSICHQTTYPPFNLRWETERVMDKEKLCASCATWVIYSRMMDCYLIDGSAYNLLSKVQVKTAEDVRANSHRQFFYQTNNLKMFAADSICLGQVSTDCRSLFKRTKLRPLSFESAKRLANFDGDRCRAKGCFDRYSCVLYDKSKERREGVWNRVPANWVPGSEGCPSFINKSIT